MGLGLLFVLCVFHQAQSAVPTFSLKNAAVAGLTMPAVGLGTGGYSTTPAGYGVYPECFNEDTGCGDYTVQAVTSWLAAGGRRLDCANSYHADQSVGLGIQKSGIPRSSLFILEKVGPTYPLGYNDTLNQMAQILLELNTTYVDLLLIHWPTIDPNSGPIGQSTDPACMPNTTTFNMTTCRLNTWKACIQIFNNGQAKAIGVSNYEIEHLQEIMNANLLLPAYNQCPFHLYRSSTQQALIDFCKSHNILFGGYSPLGVPDFHTYPGPTLSATPIKDPIVAQIAKSHGVSSAQVLIQWEYAIGIPTNPRSQNAAHMNENLNSYNFTLTADEINTLNSAPQDFCSADPDWYECAPDAAAKRAAWFGY